MSLSSKNASVIECIKKIDPLVGGYYNSTFGNYLWSASNQNVTGPWSSNHPIEPFSEFAYMRVFLSKFRGTFL